MSDPRRAALQLSINILAYHLYGVDRGATISYTRTYSVWSMIASARLYAETPLYRYHRAVSALHKIHRREAKGTLVYTEDAPETRYTSLPLETRRLIGDWLKLIVSEDETADRGKQAEEAFEDFCRQCAYTPDHITEQAFHQFWVLFEEVFVWPAGHDCELLFPSDHYDGMHQFCRGWQPVTKESCPYGCNPRTVWRNVERYLQRHTRDEQVRDWRWASYFWTNHRYSWFATCFWIMNCAFPTAIARTALPFLRKTSQTLYQLI